MAASPSSKPSDVSSLDSKEASDAVEALRARIAPEFASSADDATLLRFLRARRYDIDGALDQFTATQKWRKEINADELPNITPPKYEIYRQHFPIHDMGFDKLHRPVSLVRFGVANHGLVAREFDSASWTPVHVKMYEETLARLEEASRRAGHPVQELVWVVDLKGLTRSAFKVIGLAQHESKLAERFYPERNGAVYIVRAPWIFPMAWRLVKPFIDVRTRKKFHVLGDGDNLGDELLKHMEAEDLVKELGGLAEIPLPSAVAGSSDLADPLLLDEPMGAEHDIAAGAVFESDVRVRNDHGVCSWWFELLSDHDIEFWVEFDPAPAEDGGKAGERIQVRPPARVKGEHHVEQGSWEPPSAGLLRVVWSNKHSWMRSKKIRFLVDATDMRDDRELSVVERTDAADVASPPAAAAGSDVSSADAKLASS